MSVMHETIVEGHGNGLYREVEGLRRRIHLRLGRQSVEEPVGIDDCETAPLKSLQELFWLSDFERDCVLLAAAVELAPDFERLYSDVHGDAQLFLPTPAMTLSLLNESPEEASRYRSVFAPGAPLFRYGLLEWATTGRGGTLSRPFRIDERILGFLTDSHTPDPRISAALSFGGQHYPLARGWEKECDALERRIRTFLSEEVVDGRRLVVILAGQGSECRKAVAAEVCRRAGLSIIHGRLQQLAGLHIPLPQAISLFFREALLFSAAAHLETGEGDAEGVGDNLRHILQGIGDYSPVTFISSEKAWQFSPMDLALFQCSAVELTLSPLDYGVRLQLWEEGLMEMGAEQTVQAMAADLANRFQFGPDQIACVIAKARQAADIEGRFPKSSDIEVACRSLPVHGLENLARKIASPFDWDDIVLPADTIEQIREIAAQFRYRQKVYREWGFERKMDRGKGICVMFSGPSGTGKTMAAEILANDLCLDLYRIDLSAVVSKYIGETEKNLRRVFDEGEKSQAILFFDEADALFGKRSEVKDSHDRYANIEINYLLQRMEMYTGASILATNMRSAIDSAFLRRLRAIVEFPMPDVPQRETIWRKAFPADATLGDIDFRLLAKQFALSGGGIRNASLNGAFFAAADGGCITMEHVTRAIKREYAKLGRLCTESEFGKYL